MIRCFLGLEVPAQIRSQLVLAQFLLPVKDRIPPENFHITLLFLGEVQEDSLEELHIALETTRMGPPLLLQLEGFGLFGKDDPHNLHAVVRPDPTLGALHDKLGRLARQIGLSPERRRFAPHVTLSRLKRGRFDPVALETAIVRDSMFRSEPFAADELVLFRSTLRRDGASYDVLARYPLSR